MANGSDLEVRIGASIDGLKKGLKDASSEVSDFAGKNDASLDKLEKSFKDVSKTVKKSSLSFEELGSIINEQKQITLEFEKELIRLESQLKATGKSSFNLARAGLTKKVNNLKDAIKDQRTSLKGLNLERGKARKAQGGAIKGLTAGSEATVQLDMLTGGLAGALIEVSTASKLSGAAMRSALITSGLGVALIAIIAGVTALLDHFKKLNKESKALRDSTKSLIGAVGAEVTVMNSLLAISRDESRSKKERQVAIDKLNKTYDKFLPNLTLENISTEKVTKSTNKHTNALIRQAKIKGLQNRLSELFTQKFDEENKTIRENTNLFEKSLGIVLKASSAFGGLAEQQFLNERAGKRQSKSITEVEKNIKKLTSTINDLISEDIADPFRLFTRTDPKQIRDHTNDLISQLQDAGPQILSQIDATQEVFNKRLKKNVLLQLVPTELKLNEEQTRLKIALLNMTIALNNFDKEAGVIIQSGISNTFAGIGEALGGAISTGANVLQALGGALLSGIGTIAIELGKAAIAIGIGMIAIKKAFTNPFTAIAAGIALVAIGTLIKGASKTTGAIGGGGGGTSPGGGRSVSSGVGGAGTTGGRTSGTQNVGPSSGGFGGKVVFEIRGTSLIGVLQNSLARNKALGGSLTVQ